MSQRIRVLKELGDELERLVTASAGADVPPSHRPRWLRTGMSVGPVLAAVLIPIVVVGAALVLLGRQGHRSPASPPRDQGIAVGEPVPARSVQLPSAGTLQLRAAAVAGSPTSAVFAMLVRPVAREPDDVCFGVYATGESAAGNIGCSVRGPGRLPTVLGEITRPNSGPLAAATYLVGQAPRGATRVELVTADGARELKLSAAHMFLVVFGNSVRGSVNLRVTAADGQQLSAAFTLPVSPHQMSAFSDRYRRPGAVFNDEIGQSIIGTSEVQIIRRFGRPLATLSSRDGERCVYYDVVGNATGWSLCFKHGTTVAAGGAQQAPPGVK